MQDRALSKWLKERRSFSDFDRDSAQLPTCRAVHENDLQLLLAHFVHCGVLQVGGSSEHQVVVGQLTTHGRLCVQSRL